MNAIISELESLLGATDASVRLGVGGAPDPADAADALKRFAMQDLKRAVPLADALARAACPEPAGESQLLAARAHVLCYAARFDEAIDLLSRAADLAEASGSAGAQGQAALAMVQPLARLGRLEEAEHAARRALAAFERAADAVATGRSLLNLGIVLRMREQLGPSLDAFAAAAPLVDRDPLLCGALESNRAEVLLDLDRFDAAQASFAAALGAFSRAGNGHAAAIVEGNLADLLSREGRIDEALVRFEHARGRFHDAGAMADEARLAAEAAEALAALGATDAAVRAYCDCLPRLESASLTLEAARARLGLGLLLLGVGAEAEPLLGSAREELEALGAAAAAARARLALACLAIRSGRRDPDPHRDAAYALAQLEGRPMRRAQAIAELAHSSLLAGDAASARRYFDALGPTTRLPRALRAKLSGLRGALLRHEGRLEESAAALREGLLEAEAMRGQLRAEQWRLAHGESWRDLYLNACAAALDTHPPRLEHAFDALERLRARAMLDALGPTDTQGSGDDDPHVRSLREARRRTLDALSVLYSSLSLPPKGVGAGERQLDPNAIATLEDEAERLGDRLDAARGGSRASSEPLTLDAALASLGHGQTVVHFFAEQGSLSALVLGDGACVPARRFAPLDEVRGLLRRLEFTVTEAIAGGADGRAWDGLCRRLSAIIIEPIADRIGGTSNLGVCAFGPLVALPWAALRLGDEPLLERCTIVELPSITVAGRLPRLPPAPDHAQPLLAIGVSDELAPAMEQEAAAVAARSPGGGRALLGHRATREAVLAGMRRAPVVHFSTHCHFSSRHPLLSRLKLGDGWVTVRELAGAVLPGASIVVAGCESGRRGEGSEEDRQGLVRALHAAGARQVLASRWPLHDATARLLFDHFYDALCDRRRFDAALKSTQQKLSNQGVSPWLWAGLVVTGGMQ